MKDPKLHHEILKPSPDVALEVDYQGKPFLRNLTAPYYRLLPLAEDHRLLLSCFVGTGTATRAAVDGFLRLKSAGRNAANRAAVLTVVGDLVDRGALVRPDEGPRTMYGAAIARDYLDRRRMPTPVASWVINKGAIRKKTRVLDLACGTGALAHHLAEASDHVTGMDVSAGFLQVAKAEAARRGLRLRGIHDNGNRLLFRRERYDVVTISLALHWLEPYAAAVGISRVLEPKRGRLFIIDGGLDVPRTHPLAHLFDPQKIPTLAEDRRYFDALFHGALRGTEYPRVRAAFRYREHLTVDLPYARGFLTPEHLKEAGVEGWRDPERFWARQARKVRDRSARDFDAGFHWLAFELRFPGR